MSIEQKFYNTKDINSDLPYVQLIGKIVNFKEVGVKRSKRLTATLQDDYGTIELVWFKGIQWIKDSLKPNAEYIVFGKPNLFNGKINIAHPELDFFKEQGEINHDKLQPVYPSTEELSKKGLLTKLLENSLKHWCNKSTIQFLKYFLMNFITKLNLFSRKEAFENIHFPKMRRPFKEHNTD